MASIMQTRTDSFTPSLDWFTPFGSWEAAARWNAMAFEWMTTGWKQWMSLTTAWPGLEQPQATSTGAAAPRAAAAALDSATAATREAKPRASSKSVHGQSGGKTERAERASAGRREGRAAGSADARPRAGKQRAARPQATARSRSRTRG